MNGLGHRPPDFDLDDVGTHPCEGLGAGRAGLKLGQIQDFQSCEAIFSAHDGISSFGFVKCYAFDGTGVESDG